MIVILGVVVPIVFVLALFVGRREEKKWMHLGLLVAAFLLVVIGFIYVAIKR
ncbi:MAG: hypothetical protein ACYDGM_00160 [Vulcanimicrobiaceae bacterium]